MIKILHSADWHLDAPLLFRDDAQQRLLKDAMAKLPRQIAELCKAEQCDMMLLSGDLFDGAYAADTCADLRSVLADVGVPVFIAPGNHDFVGGDSPWLAERWPENVHIFTHPVMESVAVPELDCRVYGAGFVSMDCPGLLAGFSADCQETYALGVLHGDPTQVSSPYCPITAAQVTESALNYLALGHIHKGGSFRAGSTLCAWPGCPMGHGFDELGEKGVLIVTVDGDVTTRFIPLDVPKFYDLEAAAGDRPEAALSACLPPVANRNFYRITLTGESQPIDLDALTQTFSQFPNLELRDRTVPPVDLWGTAGQDTFEGAYFHRLRELSQQADPDTQRQILLAAKISRKILDGQEVVLP